ncbi:unnamed protein product [Closterium sp. NIES-64]|nr:unnamed protein product [Closterium sp. NIES-64]
MQHLRSRGACFADILAARLSTLRGFLELDLLLGKWVEQHLPSLDPPHLTALARLMDEVSLTSLCCWTRLIEEQAEGLPGAASAADQVGGAAPALSGLSSLVCSCAPHGRAVQEQEDPPQLTALDRSALARLMDEVRRASGFLKESPDLFKWFTGQEQAPEHVVHNPSVFYPPPHVPLPSASPYLSSHVYTSMRSKVYISIRSKVDERLHRMHPAVKAEPGLPWVRGWEDMQRQAGTPPAGNQ